MSTNIQDILTAAVVGHVCDLPLTTSTQKDEVGATLREELGIDAAYAPSYLPLIGAMIAMTPVSDRLALGFPLVQPMRLPSLSYLPDGESVSTPVIPVWSKVSPPSFTVRATSVPLPASWTLVRRNGLTLLTDNHGRRSVVSAAMVGNALRVNWPASLPLNFDLSTQPWDEQTKTWSDGDTITLTIPTTSYPFAEASAIIRQSSAALRIVSESGSDRWFHSLPDPEAIVGAVVALLVVRQLFLLRRASDGYTAGAIWQDTPKLAPVDTLSGAVVFDNLRAVIDAHTLVLR